MFYLLHVVVAATFIFMVRNFRQPASRDFAMRISQGLEAVRIMNTASYAHAWTHGQGVMRHGRRVKAGRVKHRKPKS